MTAPPRYRVIVSGTVLPEKSRADVLEALAALFHSKPETMGKLLQGKPVALTQSYERDRAEKICRAIRAAGAACRMEEIGAPPAEPPEPEQPEPRPEGRRAAPRPAPDRPEGRRGHESGHRDGPAQSTSTRHKEAAVLRFVGVNIEYYRRQFARFGSVERPAFALSWNWPAFFAFFLWASYRKLWRWAGLHLLGGLLLVVIVEPGFAYLLWALVWPLTANYLYYRHVCRCVFGSSVEPSPAGGGEGGGDVDVDPGGGSAAGGGVSRAAVGVGLILVFLSSMAFNHLITERVLERYSGATGDFRPGPGTRQRGDGSSIEEGAALSPQVAKTLTTLNTIATALKAAASAWALDDPELALSVVRRIVEQRQFNDAWGTAVAVRRDATGQVVLASAGPDRQFGNDDDILQYIHFNDL